MVFGDFNLDLLKTRDPGVRLYKEFIKWMNLSQLIQSPTRVSPTTSILIDHVLVNREHIFATSGCLDLGLSDHSLMYASRKKRKMPRPVVKIRARSYRSYDRTSFYLDLCAIDWSDLYVMRDVNQALTELRNKLLPIVNKHAPYAIMMVLSQLLTRCWIRSSNAMISNAHQIIVCLTFGMLIYYILK